MDGWMNGWWLHKWVLVKPATATWNTTVGSYATSPPLIAIRENSLHQLGILKNRTMINELHPTYSYRYRAEYPNVYSIHLFDHKSIQIFINEPATEYVVNWRKFVHVLWFSCCSITHHNISLMSIRRKKIKKNSNICYNQQFHNYPDFTLL